MTSSTAEHPAVTRFREYLRIKTMQPNPDYEGSTAFLINQAIEIGMPYKVVEVLVVISFTLWTILCSRKTHFSSCITAPTVFVFYISTSLVRQGQAHRNHDL